MLVPKSKTAAVEPRVRQKSGQPLPLLDVVSDLIESDISAVRIVGEGKTTAISHLLKQLPNQSRVRLLDDGEPVDHLDLWDLTVFTAPTYYRGNLELVLTNWNRDDCIEYLMAKNPERCKSVMNRLLKADDLWLTSGSPRVISRCLDLMIKDDAIDSMESAIAEYFEWIPFKRKSHRRRLVEKCLEHLLNDSHFGMEVQKWVPRFIDADSFKILCKQTVRYVIAADRMVEYLSSGKAPRCLEKIWTPAWTDYFTDRLSRSDCDKALDYLDELANQRDSRYSTNAASLLYQINCNWRPKSRSHLNFESVQFPGMEARSLVIEDSLLTKSDFSGSTLPHCSFKKSFATGSNFSNADLSGANLTEFVARHADFSGAFLRKVSARKSNFENTDFCDAILERGEFIHAEFGQANFAGAILNNADLTNAKMYPCNFSNTSMIGAELRYTDLCNADLRTVKMHEAHFNRCRMLNCNLEYVSIENIELVFCDFFAALFTGSKLRACSLEGSNLRRTKLGDVVWTNCDLRYVDFSGCEFMYGTTRSGLVPSPYPSHGTRTGFYTDDYDDHHFKRIEDIRKACFRGCDLRGAIVENSDFYLVDLRDAKYDTRQESHFRKSGAILFD